MNGYDSDLEPDNIQTMENEEDLFIDESGSESS